ncbi:MAG TPA: HAMP domain-containing sensor histidine kinase [Candidatus Limnocylindrales bacterium]|nr:HAMP domain-containing sensor histidine kinase [Candidatus Limnocylindrales bacterium]
MAEGISRPAPGSVAARETAPASARARAERDVVRRVRIRLLLMSGGVTLIVLVVLGVVLYATVATSLTAASVEQLRQRAAAMDIVPAFGATPISRADIVTDAQVPGLVLGGPTSGTLAFVIGPDTPAAAPSGRAAGPGEFVALIDGAAVERARAGETVISETQLDGTPVRVLSRPFETQMGTFVAQVMSDRTAEVRTLGVLLVVLLGGGLLALAASLAAGWVYADRALVPIRDALRRQREFAADASHELRTPLAIVRASVAHLRRHPEAPVETVGTALDDIDAEVGRLTSLVDDLLLLARADSGAAELERRPVDLAEVALDAGAAMAAMADGQGRRIVVDAEPAPLEGDAGRLRQLVTILLDNAIRHSPPGGEIRVAVRAEGAQATLTVDDEGRGIAPEHLALVFDRFWRAPDAPPGGAGLGLAIAAWIVERHGGTIDAGNRPGGGARFTVRLAVR